MNQIDKNYLNVWTRCRNNVATIYAFGERIDVQTEDESHPSFGLMSGYLIVGTETIPWLAEKPAFVRRSDGSWTWMAWMTYGRQGINSGVERVNNYVLTLPRILRVRGNGRYLRNVIYHQSMEIGPSFKIMGAVKGIPIPSEPSIWIRNKKLMDVPVSWIDAHARWADPQYEYLAREEILLKQGSAL